MIGPEKVTKMKCQEVEKIEGEVEDKEFSSHRDEYVYILHKNTRYSMSGVVAFHDGRD